MRGAHIFDVYETTKSTVAAEALCRISQLYEIEAAINGKTAAERLAVRPARAVHGPAWRDASRGHVSLDQLKVSAIECCRTAAAATSCALSVEPRKPLQ